MPSLFSPIRAQRAAVRQLLNESLVLVAPRGWERDGACIYVSSLECSLCSRGRWRAYAAYTMPLSAARSTWKTAETSGGAIAAATPQCQPRHQSPPTSPPTSVFERVSAARSPPPYTCSPRPRRSPSFFITAAVVIIFPSRLPSIFLFRHSMARVMSLCSRNALPFRMLGPYTTRIHLNVGTSQPHSENSLATEKVVTATAS